MALMREEYLNHIEQAMRFQFMIKNDILDNNESYQMNNSNPINENVNNSN